MRAEMKRLGHAAEAKAAKGATAVRTALDVARANPREAVAAATGEAVVAESSSDESAADDEEELDGDDVYKVQVRFCIESVPSGGEW